MKPFLFIEGVDAEVANALARSPKPVQFRNVIDQALVDICTNPGLGMRAGRVLGVRRFILPKRFPYSIVYADEPTLIRVIAFPHHKQRPGYWRSRLRSP